MAHRFAGLYVIGLTGTGKTSFLQSLMLQDIEQGQGLCFIDPHGDATDALLSMQRSRNQDVILLDAGDRHHRFGLNFYGIDDPKDAIEVSRRADQAVGVFKKLWGEGDDRSWGPRLEDLLRVASHTLIANPGSTMLDLPLLLGDSSAGKELRQQLLQRVESPIIHEFWHDFEQLSRTTREERTNPVLNKVRAFLLNPLVASIVGQSTSTIDFRQAMDTGKIVLVKLSRGLIGDDAVNLLGSVIVGLLANAAFSRAEQPASERRPFFLYADEYQRFATPAFADLLTEARKYKLATTTAHQNRAQLRAEGAKVATIAAANIAVFRVSGEDAAELALHFDRTPPPGEMRVTPVRHPPAAPLDILLKRGHRDAHVQRLVATLLGPLRRALEETLRQSTGEAAIVHHFGADGKLSSTHDPSFPGTKEELMLFLDRGRYGTYRGPFEAGLQAADRYLYECMETGSVALEELAEILTHLRGYLGWAPDARNAGERAGKEPFEYSAPFIRAVDEMSGGSFVLPAHHQAVLADVLAAAPFGLGSTKEEFVEARSDFWYRHITQYAAKRQEHVDTVDEHERQKWAPEQQAGRAEAERLAYRLTRDPSYEPSPELLQQAIQRHITKAQTEQAWWRTLNELAHAEGEQLARRRAAFEWDQLTAALPAWIDLGERLSEDPILEESGQYQEEAGPQRTYADMAGEIANRLTHLPARTAAIKIEGPAGPEEHDITTRPLPPPCTAAALHRRVGQMTKRNTADGVLRPTVEVIREINAQYGSSRQESNQAPDRWEPLS
jgi:hypothetical protein